jgi:hypothetical protein
VRVRHVLFAAALVLAYPLSANAETGCGSAPAGTNIPSGAVFLSSYPGPVYSVLSAVGEYRSHSGIAHGTGWYTHSSTRQPGQRDWDDSEVSCGLLPDWCCQGPLKGSQLRDGYPGMSQTTGGGLYAYYYEGSYTDGGGRPGFGGTASGYGGLFLSYQRSLNTSYVDDGRGTTIANWLWGTAPYSVAYDGSNFFYRVGFYGSGTSWSNYSFYQYRDYEGINQYTADWYGAGQPTWNHGGVCSTALAYAQAKALGGGAAEIWNIRNYYTDYVSNKYNAYDHARFVNGVNSLYNAIYTQCHDNNLWNNGWDGFVTDLGSAACFEAICDDAARQVANCFTAGQCYNDSDRWAQMRDWTWQSPGPSDDNGWAITRSISPDNIGGWSGWPYGNSYQSVWGRDTSQTVTWNSGGSIYSCWY